MLLANWPHCLVRKHLSTISCFVSIAFARLQKGRLHPCRMKIGELLRSYADGVNAGLAKLGARPFEYYLLRSGPKPWKMQDSVLVMHMLFLQLEGKYLQNEPALGVMRDVLPEPLYTFLSPLGNEWDAPLEGEPSETPPIPGSGFFDLRTHLHTEFDKGSLCPSQTFYLGTEATGSNNWAVAGTHTHHGGAIVANDMHMPLSVPNMWYRASLVWPEKNSSENYWRVTGATVPSSPAILVGSNGKIAWGFTNSRGDWSDYIVLDVDSNNDNEYLTPDGPQAFEHHVETIEVKGSDSVTMEVLSTVWGPVVDSDHQGRKRALRWGAHDAEELNFGIARIATKRTLAQALRLANECGGPHQNFVVADNKGQIAWTIFGRILRRVGFDGRVPTSWSDGTRYWDGYLSPEEYPRIVNPANGRIWTANNRIIAGEGLRQIGYGAFDQGARAGQIRDRLFALNKATEQDMLEVQLDDEAKFLKRWRELMLEILSPEANAQERRRAELRHHLEI